MNIALIGYGKMGKAVEIEAKRRGHHITLAISFTPTSESLRATDVAIEFSRPEAAFENLRHCLEHNLPVVCGTTGWLEKRDAIEKICQVQNGTFLYASNFSIGVNIFFEINQRLAQLMAPYTDYEVDIEEIHHTEKLDTPSGTAISLAQGIIAKTNKTDWILDTKQQKDQVPIQAKRLQNVPGTHIVTYRSPIDDIQIKHQAHNRQGFALGAVIAAEWIKDKKGVFSMKEVLGIL
ncbi:MAG: 4-hydroxy-tetrahydrodipicolinate reductase [Flavobacteriales bacterium AspAUS03]